MDVNKKQKSEKLHNEKYYDAVSKILTFVDKTDKVNKIKNKKKKGDLK